MGLLNRYTHKLVKKKQMHRAGKKARARLSKRRTPEVKYRTEFTEKALLNQSISISASQPETLISAPQETFNPDSGSDTKITFAVNLLVKDDPNNLNTYLPERKVSPELYQNTNLEGNDNESLSEDFIFRLNSLLPDELLNI